MVVAMVGKGIGGVDVSDGWKLWPGWDICECESLVDWLLVGSGWWWWWLMFSDLVCVVVGGGVSRTGPLKGKV